MGVDHKPVPWRCRSTADEPNSVLYVMGDASFQVMSASEVMAHADGRRGFGEVASTVWHTVKYDWIRKRNQ